MTIPPETTPVSEPESTSDDRTWVLLCFLFTPLFPIITFLLEEKKNRVFIKYHNVPVLILGVVEGIVIAILSLIPVVRCLTPLVWIINVVYAIKANGGTKIDIPVITGFSKGQNWS
jgi:uncharacterized protein